MSLPNQNTGVDRRVIRERFPSAPASLHPSGCDFLCLALHAPQCIGYAVAGDIAGAIACCVAAGAGCCH
jgi:hypothetical protein